MPAQYSPRFASTNTPISVEGADDERHCCDGLWRLLWECDGIVEFVFAVVGVVRVRIWSNGDWNAIALLYCSLFGAFCGDALP